MLRNNPHDFRNRNPVRVNVLPAAVGRFPLIKKIGVVLCVGLFSSVGFAAVIPSGNIWTKVTTPAATVQWTTAGQASSILTPRAVLTALPGGGVSAVTGGLSVGGVAVSSSGLITAGQIAAAAVGILSTPAGIGLTILMATPAVTAWLASSGVAVSSSGGLVGSDPAVCTVAPCFKYSASWSEASTREAACSALVANWQYSNGAYTYFEAGPVTQTGGANGLGSCDIHERYTEGKSLRTTDSYSFSRAAVAAATPVLNPLTPLQATTRLTSVPVTPVVVNAIIDAGGSFPIAYAPGSTSGPPVDTGVPTSKTTLIPASSSSSSGTVGGNPFNLAANTPTVTSTTNGTRPVVVDGQTLNIPTTTTTTSTYDPVTGQTTSSGATSSAAHTVSTSSATTTPMTYGPGTVTVGTPTTTTTTTTTNTATGAPVGTPSTSTGSGPSGGAPSTPADEQKDPCEGKPDRVGCMDVDTPTGEIPKSSKTITYQEESVFGSGSCPANLTAQLGLLGQTVTVWDWQKTCEMALPLRAMILALASFAAFLIVMPGDNRT